MIAGGGEPRTSNFGGANRWELIHGVAIPVARFHVRPFSCQSLDVVERITQGVMRSRVVALRGALLVHLNSAAESPASN